MQAIFLMPLPVATLWGMNYFNQHYASEYHQDIRLFLPIRRVLLS
jgi:hypothetical protein